MKAHVHIEGERLVVTMHGFDVVWTFRRRIAVPLAHVTGARVDPHVASHGPWLGAGRTDALLDYAVAAGPMVVHGRHEFWDVHDPERCVTIDLEDEPFERLVIEVDDPVAVVDAVNAAVQARRGGGEGRGLDEDGAAAPAGLSRAPRACGRPPPPCPGSAGRRAAP